MQQLNDRFTNPSGVVPTPLDELDAMPRIAEAAGGLEPLLRSADRATRTFAGRILDNDP